MLTFCSCARSNFLVIVPVFKANNNIQPDQPTQRASTLSCLKQRFISNLLRFCGGNSTANLARTQTNSIRSIADFESQLPVDPTLHPTPPRSEQGPAAHAATHITATVTATNTNTLTTAGTAIATAIATATASEMPPLLRPQLSSSAEGGDDGDVVYDDMYDDVIVDDLVPQAA